MFKNWCVRWIVGALMLATAFAATGSLRAADATATNVAKAAAEEPSMTNEKLTILTHAKALANLEKVQGILRP